MFINILQIHYKTRMEDNEELKRQFNKIFKEFKICFNDGESAIPLPSDIDEFLEKLNKKIIIYQDGKFIGDNNCLSTIKEKRMAIFQLTNNGYCKIYY